jgi:leader peptidase (prepilin peptidase) / N-methyltransferase
LAVFFLSKQGIGLGDMFYLAFFASLYGYALAVYAFILSFWIATAVLIIPYLKGKIDKKKKLPFSPFIFAGCIISVLSLTVRYF